MFQELKAMDKIMAILEGLDDSHEMRRVMAWVVARVDDKASAVRRVERDGLPVDLTL